MGRSKGIPVGELQQALERAVTSGAECGVQLVVYEHGKLVADLCAGYADKAHKVPVSSHTLFPVYSVGKGIFASGFHLLKERIGFDYNMRVSDVWPEYGCNGKEDTRIWHFLSHRAGMHELPGVAWDDPALADWSGMCRKLAAAAPAWKPGGKCEYHGITFAWLMGELADRLAKRPFYDFFRENVLAPLGQENDFFYGLSASLESRAAEIDTREVAGQYCWMSSFIEEPAIRRGYIPSANAFANAGAIAAIYNALWRTAGNPRPLLQRETVENAASLRRSPDDPIIPGDWALFGLGYAMPCWESSGGDIFGHGGAAGSEGFYCRSRELAVGFTKNAITPTHPVHPLRDEISHLLGLPVRHW